MQCWSKQKNDHSSKRVHEERDVERRRASSEQESEREGRQGDRAALLAFADGRKPCSLAPHGRKAGGTKDAGVLAPEGVQSAGSDYPRQFSLMVVSRLGRIARREP